MAKRNDKTCPTWGELLEWAEAEVGGDSDLLGHLRKCERCRERLEFSDFVARALGQKLDQ